MNKYFFLTMVLILDLNGEPFTLAVSAQKNEKTKIMLALIGKKDEQSTFTSNLLKKALEFKDQCAVTADFFPAILSKQEALAYQKLGYSYILFIESNADHFAWHLFDIEDGQMKKNKKVAKSGLIPRASIYSLADSIWQTLTGEPGIFSVKLAYTKEVPAKKGLHYTHIYIADYDGSNEELLVQTPTINVAPRWNKDLNRPLLFYSENTNSNMRLMAVDMHKKKIVASNFDGLNMLPAFSPDGSGVVYCATRGSGSCQMYHWSHKKIKKITNNEGNNFAPAFSDDGKTIYFSSDFEANKPQIYAITLPTGQLTRITHDGYCVSPSYNASRNQLAYAKMVNGVMQLFTYDFTTQEHRQLTFDSAQKEECAWSACGNFLLCPVDTGKRSRIALFNVNTNEYKYVTDSNDRCANPALSCIYNQYPLIS
jgi:tol-pal system beta propeller repeat protein TolB